MTPHLASSATMAAMRSHSFTRWLAMPVMRVVPSATAALRALFRVSEAIDFEWPPCV